MKVSRREAARRCVAVFDTGFFKALCEPARIAVLRELILLGRGDIGAIAYHLFVLGLLAFAGASLGRAARRQRWPAWVKLHIVGMGSSYVLMLTAFYVDNGKNLPLWRELPQWAFWISPATIGIPIILHALLRHPLARQASVHQSRIA